MPTLTEKYQRHLVALNLNNEQTEELIGALTHIVERLLDQKYLLRKECDEKNRR